MNDFIDNEWKKYQIYKAAILPTGRILKKQLGFNKLKLFNYIVQNLETKENTTKILEVNQYLADKKTKLIMITYDSFLFDFSQTDGKDTLLNIKSIMEKGGTPVKHKHGKTYSF